MVPGYSAINCRVAEFRYQLKLVESPHRHFAAKPWPESPGIHPMSSSLRQQLGMLLVRAGQYLQGKQAMARESLSPTSNEEVGANT